MKIEFSIGEILGAIALFFCPSPIAKLKNIKLGGLKMSDVKESKELVQAVVAIAKGVEASKKDSFGLATVLGQAVVVIPSVITGLQGVSQVDDELKAIDEQGVGVLVDEALVAFGETNEKSKLIVKESANIAVSLLKIFKA